MKLPPIITQEFQQSLKPDDVLQILKDGNNRFASNVHLMQDLSLQRENLKSAQYPIAVILGCIDSRTPSELIFDVGLGVVFNVRVAGNILNDDILGSIEFACKVAGAKLVVVMGHTDCGAVKAACNNVKLAHITSIMKKIDGVISDVKANGIDEKDSSFIDNVTETNTKVVKKQIVEQSEVMAEMVNSKEVKIVSCIYCLKSGVVEFS